MVIVDGYISKKVIKRWLENYRELEAGERPEDFIPSNSGPKSEDGYGDGKLNFIMLEAALEKLPRLVKACVTRRWIERRRLGETLRELGISKDVYYKRCDWAVDLIFLDLNGKLKAYGELLSKIKA